MSRLWIGIAIVALLVVAVPSFSDTNVADGWASLSTQKGFNGQGTYGDYKTNWSSHGDMGVASEMWWDCDNGNWVPVANGDDGLVVTAYVELYASQQQTTQAVFHWGKAPFAAQSVELPGRIIQNHPCWVGIRKNGWVQADQAKASHLSFEKDSMGQGAPGTRAGTVWSTNDTTVDIPLNWAMNVNGGAYVGLDWSGGTNQANWGFYSPGRLPVGTVDYNFKVTATPDLYQGDGKYTLDPEVILVPDL